MDVSTVIALVSLVGAMGLMYLFFRWMEHFIDQPGRSRTQVKWCFKDFKNTRVPLDMRHVQGIMDAFVESYKLHHEPNYNLDKAVADFMASLMKELQQRQGLNEYHQRDITERLGKITETQQV